MYDRAREIAVEVTGFRDKESLGELAAYLCVEFDQTCAFMQVADEAALLYQDGTIEPLGVVVTAPALPGNDWFHVDRTERLDGTIHTTYNQLQEKQAA